MDKQEFHDRLLALIREYDDSYEETFTEYSTDERQHAMYDIEIKVKKIFQTEMKLNTLINRYCND